MEIQVEETSSQALEAEAPENDQDVTNEAPEVPTEEQSTEPEPSGDAEPVASDEPEQVVEDDEEDLSIPDVQPVQPLSMEDLQTDAEGNIDVQSLLGTFNQRLNQAIATAVTTSTNQVTLANKYKSQWDKAEAEYPQLKEDKEVRDMVYAIHADSVERGKKYMSPKQAADRLFGKIRGAEKAGMNKAQESTTIQKSAYLETSTNASRSDTSTSADLQARLESTNPLVAQKARMEILKAKMAAGKL